VLRLFLFIFGAILITLYVVNMSVKFGADLLVNRSHVDIYEGPFQVVFFLLDEELDASDEIDRAKLTQKIDSMFKFPVALGPIDHIKLKESAAEELLAGEMVITRIDDADYLHKKSRHSEDIWSIAVELGEYDENIALVDGPMNLFLSHLNRISVSEQPAHLQALSETWGIPLQLIDRSNLDLPVERVRQLDAGRMVALEPGDDGERYFKKTDRDDVVMQIGPIALPTVIQFIYPLVFAGFIALFGGICLLWLRPLWRDLHQLIVASDTIADGDFNARIQSKSLSAIRPVIDGFNRMAERTERTIESQQSLTMAVSHELRTPLARLQFSLEMMKQAASDGDRSRHMHNIESDVGELNQLVEELLTYSRQDHTGNELDSELFPEINLTDWLESQVERARRGLPETIELSHHIDIKELESVRFHSRLMAYAVSNGISNAIRYTKQKVKVSLTQVGDDFLLHIDDDGPGIPESVRESVFDPFHRLDKSRNRESGGFGLGLSIIRKVAQWHQGRASLESSDLGGNRLVIRWPMRRPVAQDG